MELKHVRGAATLAVGGGVIALALAGCNTGGSTASSSASPAEGAPSAGSTSTGGAKAPVRQGNKPDCMASKLHAVIQVQSPGSSAKVLATLILTNRSKHSCVLSAGWAPIGTGGPNKYTPFPATRTNFPGRGMNIPLRAGSSAYAGMKWQTGRGCGPSSGIGVTWHSSWIPARYAGGDEPSICGSLVLGTLQPAMNGVNFS
ncbi:hypothetical protein GCM10029978_061700 [Actinoallomurus acanthiterrae]